MNEERLNLIITSFMNVANVANKISNESSGGPDEWADGFHDGVCAVLSKLLPVDDVKQKYLKPNNSEERLERIYNNIPQLKSNDSDDTKARECMEFLRNYCKQDGSKCGKNCPFAYEDYTVHCNLGSDQIYPCEWQEVNKEWYYGRR